MAFAFISRIDKRGKLAQGWAVMVTVAGGIILAVFVLWMISLIQNTMRENALKGRGKVGVGFIVAFGITVCAALLTLFMR